MSAEEYHHEPRTKSAAERISMPVDWNLTWNW